MTRRLPSYEEAMEQTKFRYEADGFEVTTNCSPDVVGIVVSGQAPQCDLIARREGVEYADTNLILVVPWPRDSSAQRRIAAARRLTQQHPDLSLRLVNCAAAAIFSIPPLETTAELVQAARGLLTSAPAAALSLTERALEQVLARVDDAYGAEFESLPPVRRSTILDLVARGGLSGADQSGLQAVVAELDRTAGGSTGVGDTIEAQFVDTSVVTWALDFAEECSYGSEPSTTAMIEWFEREHETPDEAGLPINPESGTWEWLGTGPVDCATALSAQFPGVRPEHTMRAVTFIEAAGTEWSRKPEDSRSPAEAATAAESPHDAQQYVDEVREPLGRGVKAPRDTLVSRGPAPRGSLRALIARRHITAWSDTSDARFALPELMRRLVVETGGARVHAVFPSDEGVDLGGFDGLVHTETDSMWVPDGNSVWELSTERSVGTKADDDYRARNNAPGDWSMGDTTYVAVSLRPWQQRHRWAAEHSADGRWRQVVALGIDDVMSWLAVAPRAELWLAERLDLRPNEYQSASNWWMERKDATGGLYGDGVVLAGRETEASEFRRRISNGVGPIVVEAASVDEALEFVAAAADTADREDVDEVLIDRVMFVSGVNAWQRLLAEPGSPLVLVAMDTTFGQHAFSTRHTVVVPASIGGPTTSRHHRAPGTSNTIQVSPPVAQQIADALVSPEAEARGIDHPRAQELGALGRRSLAALRRELSLEPAICDPYWARSSDDAPTRRAKSAALLAGEWVAQPDGSAPSWNDREVVAELAGGSLDYESVEIVLRDIALPSDPFIVRHGSTWQLVSPAEAWHLLAAKSVTPETLKRYWRAVDRVLGPADELSELHGPERGAAELRGEGFRYSPQLRRGLARTLALLSVYGSDLSVSNIEDPASKARHAVARLLKSSDNSMAVDSTRRLIDLGDVLPLLAEAAPEEFAGVLHRSLMPEAEIAELLFTDSDRDHEAVWGRSPHTHLLFAIETMAWLPGLLSDVAEVLFRLQVLDRGGRLANRPVSTFAGVFSAWAPQTGASDGSRLAALRGLTERATNPPAGSESLTALTRLLASLIPEANDIVMPGARPCIRVYERPPAETTRRSVGSYVDAVCDLLVRVLQIRVREQRDLDGLLDLLQADRAATTATSLPEQHRQQFWQLAEDAMQDFVAADSEVLRDRISRLARDHRAHPEAPWVLPTEDIERLESIYLHSASPEGDPVERHRWLFESYWPPLESGSTPGEDFEQYERDLRDRRTEAVGDIFRQHGFEGVRALVVHEAISDRAPPSLVIGDALARHVSQTPEAASGVEAAARAHSSLIEVDLQLVSFLDRDSELAPEPSRARQREFDLAIGYMHARFRQLQIADSSGWTWLRSLASREGLNSWQRARLIEASRDVPRTWQEAQALGADVLDAYWRVMSWVGLGHDFAYLEEVANGLLSAGRFGDTVNLLATYSGEELLPSGARADLSISALRGAVQASTSLSGGPPDPWCLKQVMNSLVHLCPLTEENLAEPRQAALAELQVACLDLWDSDEEIPFIHTRMALDPSMFVEVVSTVYRRATDRVTGADPDLDLPPEARRQREQRLLVAYRILRSWQRPPGRDSDGNLDIRRLRQWLDEARRQLDESDRRDIGDEHIGRVLSAAEPDPSDGIAPPCAVRQLLEEGQGTPFEEGLGSGLCYGVSGARGGLVAELTEAAKLAEQQVRRDAAEIADRWPATARLLRRVADAHAHEARRWQEALDEPH